MLRQSGFLLLAWIGIDRRIEMLYIVVGQIPFPRLDCSAGIILGLKEMRATSEFAF